MSTVNRCVAVEGKEDVNWGGRGEKGVFTVEWILARQENGGGYLRSGWCKQTCEWARKCGQGMNRAFSKWWEISLQIASSSGIRSILDCQANLFSVFFCLPRATAFTSCFVYSPEVHWRAHTADSLGYICSLEKTQIRNWPQHRVCGRYSSQNHKSRCTKKQTRPVKPSVSQFTFKPVPVRRLVNCVWFVPLPPSRHVNRAFPEGLWTESHGALRLTVPYLVTIDNQKWLVD